MGNKALYTLVLYQAEIKKIFFRQKFPTKKLNH